MKAVPDAPGDDRKLHKLTKPIAKKRVFRSAWVYDEPLHNDGDSLDDVIETAKGRLCELQKMRKDGVDGFWIADDGGVLILETEDPDAAAKHDMEATADEDDDGESDAEGGETSDSGSQ